MYTMASTSRLVAKSSVNDASRETVILEYGVKESSEYTVIEPIDLARLMDSKMDTFILLDCQPTLAYNSQHIRDAFGLNLNPMIAKRLAAGRVQLEDIIIPKCSGRDQYRRAEQVVIYDESTCDLESSKQTTLKVFVKALSTSGKTLLLLRGGFQKFQSVYPTYCKCIMNDSQISIVSEDVLAWQTAPPVRITSYIIVGSERDASSKDCFDSFNIKFVLNVTNQCPNYFEGDSDMKIKYFRIPAQDNGKMRLLDYFEVANQFIAEARSSKSSVLIHCVAGISRSVTVTIAYLMKQYNMPLQKAYDHVKRRRPAISPNLNFMGQLLEYERMLDLGNDKHSPELLAMDPLAIALQETLNIETTRPDPLTVALQETLNVETTRPDSCSETDPKEEFVSGIERTSSSSSSGSVGFTHSTSYQRLDSSGIYTSSGLSASFAGGSQGSFNLKKPSRKKRTQSEADMNLAVKMGGGSVVNKDGYSKRNTEPQLPRVVKDTSK
jgi:dual specificity MAP kinase phosphatase